MSKTILSTACKKCHPQAGEKYLRNWNGDILYTKNGNARKPKSLFVREDENLVCTNCGDERHSPRRKGDLTKMTPSQERAIERCKYNLMNHRDEEPYKVEAQLNEYGTVSLVINTHEHPMLNTWFHAFIGRKGGIEVVTFRSGVSGKEHSRKMANYFREFTGAKIKSI